MSENFEADTALLNGELVEIAPLATIDFHKLADNDSGEAQRLLDCCERDGFFYLNLQGPHPSNKILDDKETLLDVMKNYFDQPDEVKSEDDIDSMTDGCVFLFYFNQSLHLSDCILRFKPIGKFAGVNRNSRDCYETLRVIIFDHFYLKLYSNILAFEGLLSTSHEQIVDHAANHHEQHRSIPRLRLHVPSHNPDDLIASFGCLKPRRLSSLRK